MNEIDIHVAITVLPNSSTHVTFWVEINTSKVFIHPVLYIKPKKGVRIDAINMGAALREAM